MDIVALDKTGTITSGTPAVTDIIPFGCTENELLSLACSLEEKSEHPLAKAVMEKGRADGVAFAAAENFAALPGNGVKATVKGAALTGGSLKFVSDKIKLSNEAILAANRLSEEGKTPLLFCENDAFKGIIAVADEIKPDSAEAIKELKDMGVRVVMITGDNERTARAIGSAAGVDEVIAGVLPDGKEAAVANLRKSGKTAMVGDGINDAPALTRADVGIAIGAGADVAKNAADVVLVNGSLKGVSAAIRLSRATVRNIHENLFWAFAYNVICIPVAAGCLVFAGLTLNPMWGAAAMSLSSFCVVMNALRLNLFKVNDARRDKKRKNKRKKSKEECKTAQKTVILSIEGMMCPHCENTIETSLMKVEGVKSVRASHEKGTAVVVASETADVEKMKEAVEAADYTVTGVTTE